MVLSGGTCTMADLRRSASRLDPIATELAATLSGCDKEGQKAGRDLRSSVGRMVSSINRAASNRESANKVIELKLIENDLDQAQRALQRADGAVGCGESSEQPAGAFQRQ
jgi:hypothetical protein